MAVLALPGRLDDKLETSVAGVVVDGHEDHGAAALDAAGPDPAAHNHTLAGEGVRGGLDCADGCAGRGLRGLQVVGSHRELSRQCCCCHRGRWGMDSARGDGRRGTEAAGGMSEGSGLDRRARWRPARPGPTGEMAANEVGADR